MPMHVGVMQFELHLPGARSLKDKRRVVKSLKDRLHRSHMVSVAEVDAQDHHRIAMMGLSMTSPDARVIQSVFDRVVEKVRSLHDARLASVEVDIVLASDLGSSAGETLWTPGGRRGADAGAGGGA